MVPFFFFAESKGARDWKSEESEECLKQLEKLGDYTDWDRFSQHY